MSPDPTFSELVAILTEQLPSAGPNNINRAARVLEMMFKLHKTGPAVAPTKSKSKDSSGRRYRDKPVAESLKLKRG